MAENAPNGIDLDGSDDGGESEGLDLERVRELGGFVLRAARRRLKLSLATFAVIAGIGITVAATMPRTYTAEVKLLAQGSSVIRTLSASNPGMAQVDNPTTNVATMIMRRDNLVALAKDAHLAERFEETRSPALRLKDRVTSKLFGAPSPEDEQLIMALTLQTKIEVTVSTDSIVDISVDWSNPQIAYDLATLVQKNFLEARYDSDVAAINESIAILDDHAKSELATVDAQLDDFQKLVASRLVASAGAAPGTVASTRPGVRPAQRSGSISGPAFLVDPEVTRALEEKRQQIKSLEDDQQRSVDAARQQLMQAQLTLTPMHPTVIALQQRVAAMSEPSPELAQLRGEEHALMAQIVPPKPVQAPSPVVGASASPRPDGSGSATEAASEPPVPVMPPGATFGQTPDGHLQLAQSKLEAAIRNYQDAVGRGDAARVELEITRAAYKHRYTVFSPAEVPKRPKKPTAIIVGGVSLVAALLLALLVAAAADLGTGLVLESWQVRRRLKLDILGELDNPS